MRFVIAGNHAQYLQYLDSRGLNPIEYRYISGIERMLGLPHGATYILTGTFWERPDLAKLTERIEATDGIITRDP
jgi:hypothetical protein